MKEEKMNLLFGNCLDKIKDIKDESVDMIMFDAPFYQDNQGKHSDKIENYRDWIKDMCLEFDRVLKHGGNICYLNAPKYIYATCDIFLSHFIYRNDIPLIRQGSFRPAWMLGFQHNILMMFCKGDKKVKWNGATKNNDKSFPTDVWDDIKYRNGYRGKGKGNWHPEAIGVDITSRCVCLNSNEGDTILDPCMGSGTTGVVCARTNRKFIGMEKEEKYFQICKNRIYGELEQLKMDI